MTVTEAHQALMDAQDEAGKACRLANQARVAYQKSKSKIRAEAWAAAEDLCEETMAAVELATEALKRAQREAARKDARAIAAARPAQLSLF